MLLGPRVFWGRRSGEPESEGSRALLASLDRPMRPAVRLADFGGYQLRQGGGERVVSTGDEKQANSGAALPAREKIRGPLRDTVPQRARSFSGTPTRARVRLRPPPWTWRPTSAPTSPQTWPSPCGRIHRAEGSDCRRPKGGSLEAGDMPYVSPPFCHTPPGGGVRHPHSPGTPGPQGREHDDDLHPRPEPGAGGRPQPSRPAREPAHPCIPSARRQPAGRNRLQAPAAHPGEVQRPPARLGPLPPRGYPLRTHGKTDRNRLQHAAARKEIDRSVYL